MPQFDYQQLCHFVLPEQGGLSVDTILKRFLHLLPAYRFSMRTVISVSQTSHPVWSATLPTAIIPIP